MEKLIRRIVVREGMSETEIEDAIMGTTAASVRILHSRGLQFLKRQEASPFLP